MKFTQLTKTIMPLGPQASSTTARSVSFDTEGASEVKVSIPVSQEANTNAGQPTVLVQSGPDTEVTNFTDIEAASAVDNENDVVAVRRVDMSGKGRYLRVVVTPGTTTNDAITVGGVVADLLVGVMKQTGDTADDKTLT